MAVSGIHKIEKPWTAYRIIEHLEPEAWDHYHVNIKAAAEELVQECQGDLEYISQYSSGTCLFGFPDPLDNRFFKDTVLVPACKTS